MSTRTLRIVSLCVATGLVVGGFVGLGELRARASRGDLIVLNLGDHG